MRSFKARRLLSIFATALVCLPLTAGVAIAQAPKPLTSSDLIQMKTSGFDEQLIVNAITTNGVSIDTSIQGLLALKQAGLSDKVINAVLAAAAPKPPAASTAAPDPSIPDEIGAYAVIKGAMTQLPVEVVNFKTAGTLGMAFTYGIKKAKFQGTVSGAKSSAQLSTPVSLIIRCADGTAPNEYQLVPLDAKKDSREFTESKMGLTGASGGVNNEAIALKFEKIAKSTYRATASDLKKGEYGFLAPGAMASMNGASTGKLYTFGVLE